MTERSALITGITGQDGSYLAEFLLDKGYRVYGLVRRTSMDGAPARIAHLMDRLTLLEGDLGDESSLIRAIQKAEPAEIYNLAAQSHVHTSFNQPMLTGDITGLGVTRLLEAISHTDKSIKFYQASSSEMFGNAETSPQNELTRFLPRSPYAVAKVYGHLMTRNYRESYDLFACSGILFNHESARRGTNFVTRKITHAVAGIASGQLDKLELGTLDAMRDWGYAGDYVRAMWLMLQNDEPRDYVVGSGVSHSVRDFCAAAFGHVGLDWEQYVVTTEANMRPAEVYALKADASLIKRELGWEPTVSFEELVAMMVDNDLRHSWRRATDLL